MRLSPIEAKRKEAELMSVQSARMALEVKIMEREDDIARIKEHIEIQRAREQVLKRELTEE